MNRNATSSVTPSIAARTMYGTPRFVACAMTPPETVPTSIATPPTIWARPKMCSRWPVKPVAVRASTSHASVAPEKKVNPRPSRIEAIAQPQQRRVDLPHHEVEQRRAQQRHGAEQERQAPTARVGDDPGRDLEDHLADREEGVGGEGLGVVQPGVEQEDRVDAPDERRREGREQRQDEIGPLDVTSRIRVGRCRGHGRGNANRPEIRACRRRRLGVVTHRDAEALRHSGGTPTS